MLCMVLRCSRQSSNHQLLQKVIASVQAGASLVYRHGLLKKGVGLCHGIAGSVFALLAVSDVLDRKQAAQQNNQSLKKKGKAEVQSVENNYYYLARAVHLAHLAISYERMTAQGEMSVPDRPWSLYEGMAGMCCAWGGVLRRLTSTTNEGRSEMPGFDDVDTDTWASW